ncbi:dentin sialophosphoprotein-like [Dorcoceras hygrometricum]|uniref:Dentin sialophosphoprotein-like n=1 Tax=Dorcoceras hygrometricum TaxID=472368 RepID=A0A2Z7C9M8_9LAMI|nr:dentin sialophosphoprotein-like [Dorcoceras hygrometricum]
MEDEKGDVGLVCSAGVSGSPVLVNLDRETLKEVIESEKQTESYEEEDGGEVMVEIVGSDVFVDGISSRKGGYIAGETGDLEGHTSENQDFGGTVEASIEGHISELEESKVVLMVIESKHVAENQEDGCGESATESPLSSVGVVNDDSCNHSILSTGMLSSVPLDSVIEQCEAAIVRTTTMVIEEKVAKDETVDNASTSDLGTPEVSRTPVETVVAEKGDLGKVKLLYPANDSANCPDTLHADSVIVNEATDVGTCDQAAPSDISLNSNGEDCVVHEVGLFSSSSVDAIDYGDIDPSHSVDLNLSVSVSDVADPIPSEEVASSGRLKDEVLSANAECGSSNDDGGKVANEGAVATETEKPILKSDPLVPNHQDNNQVCIEDFDCVECDVTRGINGITNAGVESSGEHSVATEQQEAIVMDSDDVLPQGKLSSLCKNICPGAAQKGSILCDVLDLKDGDLSLANKNECGLMVGIQPDIEDNHDNLPNTTRSSCVGDEEIIESDSGRCADQPLIGTSDTEVINDEKFALSQVKVLAEDGTRESSEEIDGSNVVRPCASDMITTSVEVKSSGEADANSGENNGVHIMDDHVPETTFMIVGDEIEFDQTYDVETEVGYREEPPIGTEEAAYESENSKFLVEEPVKSASSLRMNQPGYLPPPENEGKFALSDLVWGKVRSYPWWPGQIFDPADASERAVKYYKKDSYLVAYFGDRTFAWNDASVLKPFRPHFSQIEKQSNSEAFQNAVDCALEEVSRRVELGLTCSCVPEDVFDKIKTQIVENTGIREESSLRTSVDQSTGPSAFEPDKLLEYVRDLAPRASSRADKLDLVIARAQLSAFYCFKGYRLPTVFPSTGELLETDAEETSDMLVSHKSKHIPKDSFQSRKERSLTELMGDAVYSPDAEDELGATEASKSISSASSKKRKALDPLADGSEKRLAVPAAKVTISANQTPKPSFKIGECIRRVACQLTGSTSLKGLNDETVNDGSLKAYEQSERQSMDVSRDSSLNEMLSQLQLVAQDPKKRHNFLNTVITFFKGFRSSSALNKRGRKKRAAPAAGGSAEDFEFDDVNDSYWTDRIVQNYAEEQLLHNSENGADSLQLVTYDAEKSVKPGRKSHSRKRLSTRTYPTITADSEENVQRKKQESSPAELILNFEQRNCVPSEINLNKMFRRFGPLMESETEVDHESGRARVIFKKGSDAEVAHNSAEKFNIFGPVLVNYEIGYSPLISVKISPVAVPQQCQEDPTLML